MQRNRYFILSVFSLAIGFSLMMIGCEETPSSSGNDPVMQAKVNGTTWSAGNNVDGTLFGSLKTITGTAGDGTSISFDLKNVTSMGTLEVDGGTVKATYVSGSTAYNGTSGTINITALDAQNNISGTFEFEGEAGGGETVSVESGTFTATLR